MQHKILTMKGSKAIFATFMIFAAFHASASSAAVASPVPRDLRQDEKKEPSSKQKPQSGSVLTGCVDEQQGHYVLVDERSLNPVADLVADGFPTEGFAKHVGHKVTVRGTSNSDGARPVLKVRSIETISEICAPKEPQLVKP